MPTTSQTAPVSRKSNQRLLASTGLALLLMMLIGSQALAVGHLHDVTPEPGCAICSAGTDDVIAIDAGMDAAGLRMPAAVTPPVPPAIRAVASRAAHRTRAPPVS